MPPPKAKLNAAARARAGRQRQRQITCPEATHNVTLVISSDSENSSESPGLGEDAMDSEIDEIEELAGPELMQSLEREMEREAEAVRKITLFDKFIEASRSGDNWKRAESRI